MSADLRFPRFYEVTLVGRLTRVPDLKYTSKGSPTVSFGLAYNYKDCDEEIVVFKDCEAYGFAAERFDPMKRQIQKGDPILVSGRVRLWKGKDGNARECVVCSTVEFLTWGDLATSQLAAPQTTYAREEATQGRAPSSDVVPEDDIPF